MKKTEVPCNKENCHIYIIVRSKYSTHTVYISIYARARYFNFMKLENMRARWRGINYRAAKLDSLFQVTFAETKKEKKRINMSRADFECIIARAVGK